MRSTTQTFTRLATIGVLIFTLAGCATHSRKHNNTLIGAGLGAATGAVLTQGDPLYTVGGAAAGGLLGNILTEEKRSYKSSSSRGRSHAAPGHNKHRWQDSRNGRNRAASRSRRR